MRKSVAGKNIIIIGAGIGGLSAGILLANLGFSVTIMEKNKKPGGLMRSYIRQGIDCPVGVHYVGALGPDEPLGKMFRVLGVCVNDLFYPMGAKGVIDRYLFDNFVFEMPVGFDAYEENLRKAFPQETAAVTVLMRNIREISGRMKKTSFFLRQANPFQDIDYFRPMSELLDELQASVRLRAVLAAPCQLIGLQLADCPVIFHHMVLGGYLFSAWRLKAGGEQMADVFAARFAEAGGRLLLNSTVQKICLSGGEVAGVELESGEKLPADTLVAAIHPKILLNLLPENTLRPSIRERILTLQETDGVVAVQASFDALPEQVADCNIYRLHCDSKGEISNGLFCQVRKTNVPETNFLSAITRSQFSNWKTWEGTTSGKRGVVYNEKKLAAAYTLLKEMESICGYLKNLRLLDTFTPLTLRDYMNCPEGSCYGVRRSSRQLMKIASLNHLPIGGLHLAGQNAVAPGVMGAVLSSFNVAREIVGESRFLAEFERQL